MRVIRPSILSKLLQKLFRGFSPNMSATATIPTKAAAETIIHEKTGLYSLSLRAKMSQAAKTISVMILKAKFLPVIYGKNIGPVIRRGMKGKRKTPPMAAYLAILFMFSPDILKKV